MYMYIVWTARLLSIILVIYLISFVFSLQSDQLHVLGFVDHVIQHLKENFVNGKNRWIKAAVLCLAVMTNICI